MRQKLFLLAAFALAASGCSVEAPDDSDGDEDVAEVDDAIAASVFYRSDQVSFGRAPSNTSDRSKDLHADFSDPAGDAAKVLKFLDDHPGFDKPLYLGCIHTWIYDVDATYRANVHTLVSRI